MSAHAASTREVSALWPQKSVEGRATSITRTTRRLSLSTEERDEAEGPEWTRVISGAWTWEAASPGLGQRRVTKGRRWDGGQGFFFFLTESLLHAK